MATSPLEAIVVKNAGTLVEGGLRWGGPKMRSNPHVNYRKELRPYHRKVAVLADRYTPRHGSVLDVGCGNGVTLASLHRRRPDLSLIAADIDPECVRLAAARVPLASGHVLASTAGVQLDDLAPVDTVLCSHVLEHTRAPAEFIDSLMARIRTGGILILAVPNPVRPDVILGNVVRRHYVNRGHVVAWDRSHWMNFLETILGLNVVEYAADFVPIPFLSRIPIVNRVQELLIVPFPWFGFSHIAVLRK